MWIKRIRQHLTPFAVIVTACLVLAAVLLFDLIPFLRGGYGWQWPFERVPLLSVLPLLLILAVYLAAAWLLRRRSIRWLILWVMVGVAAVTWGSLRLRADDPFAEMVARTMSPHATGTHALAADLPLEDPGWREWTTVMQRYDGRIAHVTLAPPALPLLYAALFQLLDRMPTAAQALQQPLITYQCRQYQFLTYTPSEWGAVWLGLLMPFWAALGVIPLAAVARRFMGESALRLALIAFPLIPSLTLFAGTWNTLYPLMSLAAFLALQKTLDRGHAGWGVLAGVLSGLWVFVNFAFVPLLLFFGVYTLVHWYFSVPRGSFLKPVMTGVWFGVGLVLPWIVYLLFTGQTIFSLLSVSMDQHLALERDFLPWLWLHFWDWALWTGLPLIGLWLLALLRWRGKPTPPTLALALLITLVILLITNVARGETGRVWLLFAPFALIAAFDAVERIRPSSRQIAALFGVQTVWLIVIGVTLLAVETWLPSRPDAPPLIRAEEPANAVFEPGFELIGWSGEQVEDGILLTLNWRASQQQTLPLWFSALTVNEQGNPVGNSLVWMPANSDYPTTCWRPGEIVTDRVVVPLSDAQTPGNYWISLAAFSDPDALDRVSVVSGEVVDTQIGLGAITIR